ncbi:MAG: NAD(P)H-hydrate dehydratase [Pseudohongiella sp.]
MIGGDTGFGGAAIMAAQAAARCGAGTVSLLTRPAHVSAMLARQPEIMVCGLDAWQGEAGLLAQRLVEKASVLVIGPGLGQSAWSRQLLQQSVMWAVSLQKPLILDADALNLVAQDDRFWQESAPVLQRRNWIITPHPGEAARLLATTTAGVQADRFAAVAQLQARTGAVCLLKGAGSLLAFAPDTDFPTDTAPPVDVCTEGNPGMATGGMGDILTGVIAALVAQGLSPADALRCGVCAHGEAADIAVAARGERGLLATDLLSELPRVLNVNEK